MLVKNRSGAASYNVLLTISRQGNNLTTPNFFTSQVQLHDCPVQQEIFNLQHVAHGLAYTKHSMPTESIGDSMVLQLLIHFLIFITEEIITNNWTKNLEHLFLCSLFSHSFWVICRLIFSWFVHNELECFYFFHLLLTVFHL